MKAWAWINWTVGYSYTTSVLGRQRQTYSRNLLARQSSWISMFWVWLWIERCLRTEEYGALLSGSCHPLSCFFPYDPFLCLCPLEFYHSLNKWKIKWGAAEEEESTSLASTGKHTCQNMHMLYTQSNNKEPVNTSISSALDLSFFLANEYTAPWLKRDRELLRGEQRLTGLPRPRYSMAEKLRLFHLWNNVLKILLALTTHWLSANCLK